MTQMPHRHRGGLGTSDLGPRLRAAVVVGRGARHERPQRDPLALVANPAPDAHAPVFDRRARDLESASSVSICGPRALLIQRIQSTDLWVMLCVAKTRPLADRIGASTHAMRGLQTTPGKATMRIEVIETRQANPADADNILAAHIDSIRSIGPRFYSTEIVQSWSAGLTPDVYVNAMEGGEVFFIAIGRVDGEPAVLGFASHRVDDAQDGASVYVRGIASRCGVGTKLFRLAEEHARVQGAKSISIQASLAGVSFYLANGFEEVGRGEAVLMSGRSMPCVFMRKFL